MAALRVQAQGECRHLAALRVRVQGTKRKVQVRRVQVQNLSACNVRRDHIAPPTTTLPHVNRPMMFSVSSNECLVRTSHPECLARAPRYRVPALVSRVPILLGRRWRFGRAGGCGGYQPGVHCWAELLVVAVDDLLDRRVEELYALRCNPKECRSLDSIAVPQ